MGWWQDHIAELAEVEARRGDRPWYSLLAQGESPPAMRSEAPGSPQERLSPSGRGIPRSEATMRPGASQDALVRLGRLCPWRGKTNCPKGNSQCHAEIGPYRDGEGTDDRACARCMRENLLLGRKR